MFVVAEEAGEGHKESEVAYELCVMTIVIQIHSFMALYSRAFYGFQDNIRESVEFI